MPHSKTAIDKIKQVATAQLSIKEIASLANVHYKTAYNILTKSDIPFRAINKPLTDVQRHLIRKRANSETSIKQLAKSINATYYMTEKFLNEERLLYKTYKSGINRNTKLFCWEMYNNAIY